MHDGWETSPFNRERELPKKKAEKSTPSSWVTTYRRLKASCYCPPASPSGYKVPCANCQDASRIAVAHFKEAVLAAFADCPSPAYAARLSAWASPGHPNNSQTEQAMPSRQAANRAGARARARDKAEQKKTVEQSNPNDNTTLYPASFAPWADKQLNGYNEHPSNLPPVSGSVGATCPSCGDCHCRIRAARRDASITT